MTPKTISFWLTTGLVSLGMTGSGFAYLSGAMNEAMIDHLGYPAIFVTLLGTWKLLGAVALLVPGFPKITEWAYAGFFFTFTGAFLSHIAVGDALAESIAPLAFLALLGASYALRASGQSVELTTPAMRPAMQ